MANSSISAIEKMLEALGVSSSPMPSVSNAQQADQRVKEDMLRQLKYAQQMMGGVPGQLSGGLAGSGGSAGSGNWAMALQQSSLNSSSLQDVVQKEQAQRKAVATLSARISQLRDASAVKIMSRVPDLVGTITAWRGWKIADGKLCALGMTGIWEPKKIVKAVCSKAPASSHDAPTKDCKCGYWSFRTMELLQQALDPYATSVQVIGSVELWGKVVECENGFRSEFAYPKELWLLEEGLEHLSWTYGVPVRQIEACDRALKVR